MSYRSDVVHAAVREWQAHPEGRPGVYWRDVLPPSWSDADVADYARTKDWCGGFALWALREAGLASGVSWQDGIGFIAPANLPRVTEPSPGDILVVPEPFQHQAVVVSYEPTTGMVTTIDGNQPGIAAKARFQHGNLQFYSIQPFVDEAERTASSLGYVLAGAALAAAATWVWLYGLPGPLDRAIKRLAA